MAKQKQTDLSSIAVKLVERQLKHSKHKMIMLLVIVVVIAAAVVYIMPQLNDLLAEPEPPVTVINELTDEEKAELLKNKAILIQSNVLGEARQRSELLVLEQDIQVETVLEDSLAGLDIFKRTKRIVSYGTGYFDIDLNQLTENSIKVDHDRQLVTIKVPRAALKSVSIDESKTEYEDTQKGGMLGFGELKLTAEQQGLFRKTVEDDMREQLQKPEILEQADTAGKTAILDIYEPVVTAVSEGYRVEIAFAD